MTSTNVPGPVRKALRDGGKLWVARLYRHEILHARTVKGMQIEAMDAWNRIVIKPILRAVASRLSDFDLRGSDVVLDAFPQLRALEQEIRTTAANGAAAVRRLTTERITSLVGNEIDWIAENAKKSLGVVAAKPTTEAVMRSFASQPFLGEKVEKWFDKMLAQPTGDSARRVVQTGLQRGFNVDEITRLLRGRKETGYTDGALSGTSTRDVQTLVRTAATHASAVSRTESFKLIGVKKWRFVATLDSKTSVQCAANDGTTWPLGEGPLPPLHPNAVFAGSTFIPYGDCEEMVHARYRGPAVNVLAGDYRTTIGPNHPMLTSRGMVKAAELRKGDKLLRDMRHDLAGRAGESNLKEVRVVEDVFQSLLSVGARSCVATSGHDLHGDRVFCEGEVEVVESKGRLLSILDSDGVEHLRELNLMRPDVQAHAVAGLCSGNLGPYRVAIPSAGSVSGANSWVLADDHWVWVTVDDVSIGVFQGSAFDATTKSSLYCSDGFVVSNCRSVQVPDFGDPIGDRASIDGPVPADTTFEGWLEGQGADVQDEVLGKTKAAAWRSGDLTLKQMLGADLEPLTVAELRRLDRIPDEPDDEQ